MEGVRERVRAAPFENEERERGLVCALEGGGPQALTFAFGGWPLAPFHMAHGPYGLCLHTCMHACMLSLAP